MHIGKRFKKVHRIGGRSWKNFFISRSCIGNIWGAFFNNLSNTSSDNKNISVQTYVLEIGGLKIEYGGERKSTLSRMLHLVFLLYPHYPQLHRSSLVEDIGIKGGRRSFYAGRVYIPYA